MAWGFRKCQGTVSQCLEKPRNLGIQESHKNDKLDIVTFKRIGLKLHTSGPKPTKHEQIDSNKDIQCCYSCLFKHFTPSQCLC